MKIAFSKYQGTGNDFILLDNQSGNYSALSENQIRFLCERRFGIGADGLILLETDPALDFSMKYFNSDGRESSMCGNGGRCIAAFANALHLIKDKARFSAIDGDHEAYIISREPMIVKLKMSDVPSYEKLNSGLYLNTGSPHVVEFVDELGQMDIVSAARQIRYSDRFRKEGTNVNFVRTTADGISVRSYERGVEDETLSCGTGVTAAVLACVLSGKADGGKGRCEVQAMGGKLTVFFRQTKNGFEDVWLEGEARFVFAGEIELN